MSERFYCEDWECYFESPLEKLMAECSNDAWFDPCNDIWQNRLCEKKEFELRQKFKEAGRLEDYFDGTEEL
jgi:hypothetical protein